MDEHYEKKEKKIQTKSNITKPVRLSSGFQDQGWSEGFQKTMWDPKPKNTNNHDKIFKDVRDVGVKDKDGHWL